MSNACEYSKLTIPNDPAYAAIAASFVGEISAKVGFEDQERHTMEEGLADAILKVMELQ